jgi:outer membrane protein assembly factor BamA
MAKLLQYLLLFIFLLNTSMLKLAAQQPVKISYKIDSVEYSAFQQLKLDSVFSESIALKKYIKDLPALLMKNGFITASIDSILETKTYTFINLFLGKRYLWKALTFDSSELMLQPEDQFNKIDLADQALKYYSNIGYPFAAIMIDSIKLLDSVATGHLKINKGNIYRIDSFRIVNKKIVSNNFIQHYAGIKSGELYNQQKIDDLNNAFSKLDFLDIIKPADVSFYNSGAVINVYVKPKKINQLNFLLGLIPGLDYKFSLIGEAAIFLKNSFANGETIGFNWQQLQDRSPRLNIEFRRPYILNAAVGIDVKLNLFKKDSVYLNINISAGVSFYPKRNSELSIHVNHYSGQLLNVDTTLLKSSKKLPAAADLKYYGVGFNYKLDSRNETFNPTHGSYICISSDAGTKKLIQNNTILQLNKNEFDYSSLYNKHATTYQAKLQLQFEKYFQLASRSVFKTAVNSAAVFTDQYYLNELYQLGGFKLLRGFDDESIYAKQYLVATTEFRYLLTGTAYFQTFADAGFVNNKLFSKYFSGGIGVGLQSKNGRLNLSYAAGKQDNIPFNLKNAKIHLAFVSLF